MTGFSVVSVSLLSTLAVGVPVGWASNAGTWVVTLGVLAMGLADWIGGDDEEAAPAPDSVEGGGDEDGDDFFDGDVDGGSGDGGEDLGDLGDLDDGGGDLDDDGGLGGGDGGTSHLEPRMDELESELEGLSATVSTVRSENEEISETVAEVEENVRKLLDVYEMVTQGVNPFVDEVEESPVQDGSFGLFGDAAGSAQPAGTGGDHAGETAPADGVPDGTGNDEADEDDLFVEESQDDDGFVEDDAGGAEETEGDVTTFEDLKAEYEGEESGSDDAEPSSETVDEVSDDLVAEDADADAAEEFRPEVFEDDAAAVPADFAAERTADEGAVDDPVGDDGAAGSATDEVPPGSPDTAEGSDATEPRGGESGAKPYLVDVPDGVAAEVLVMEWMEFLLSHADTAETVRAIRYYRNVGWIGEAVADHLREVVRGFDAHGGTAATDGGLSGLTIDHHTRSLEYVRRLAGDGIEAGLVGEFRGR